MRAEWDNKPEVFGKTRICDKCGKQFTPAVFHQYVEYFCKNDPDRPNPKNGVSQNGRVKMYYCSYPCYRGRKEPTKSRTGAKGKRVQMFDANDNFLHEFPDAQQAALWLEGQGIHSNNRGVQRCCFERGMGRETYYRGFIFKYKEVKKE